MALLKYTRISRFPVINLPLVTFNSDLSECREVLLCFFFCVCVCKQVLHNLKCSLACFHKHLGKLQVLVSLYSVRKLTGTNVRTKSLLNSVSNLVIVQLYKFHN